MAKGTNMNKTFFKYLKKDMKSHYKINIFMLIQFVFVFFVFSLLFSYVHKIAIIKKYTSDNYESITKCEFFSKDSFPENNLDNYEILGGYHCDSLHISSGKGLDLVYADDFMFDNFKLPLVKGRYPKEQGEALVSWKLKDQYSLGEVYTLEQSGKKINIKIVGYIKGKYGYGHEVMRTFSEQFNGFIIYQNDLVFEIGEDYVYLRISSEEAEQIQNSYFKNQRVLENIQTVGINLLDELKGSIIAFMTYCLFLLINITLIILLNNIVFNKINYETERAVYGLCGVPVKIMMNSVIIKNLFYYIVSFIISFVATYKSFIHGKFYFDLSYEGWSIAMAVGFLLVALSTFISIYKIKNQKICEILNTDA